MPDVAPTNKGARFWNRFADRYAARPIKDTAAYEALLADVAGRLRATDHVLEIGCGTGGGPFDAICAFNVLHLAERTRLPSNLLLWMPLGLQGLSELLDM